MLDEAFVNAQFSKLNVLRYNPSSWFKSKCTILEGIITVLQGIDRELDHKDNPSPLPKKCSAELLRLCVDIESYTLKFFAASRESSREYAILTKLMEFNDTLREKIKQKSVVSTMVTAINWTPNHQPTRIDSGGTYRGAKGEKLPMTLYFKVGDKYLHRAVLAGPPMGDGRCLEHHRGDLYQWFKAYQNSSEVPTYPEMIIYFEKLKCINSGFPTSKYVRSQVFVKLFERFIEKTPGAKSSLQPMAAALKAMCGSYYTSSASFKELLEIPTYEPSTSRFPLFAYCPQDDGKCQSAAAGPARLEK